MAKGKFVPFKAGAKKGAAPGFPPKKGAAPAKGKKSAPPWAGKK